MRLIDVDNFKKNNPEYLKLDIDYVTEVTVEDVLDCEPTVKAIPVEWIEGWMKNELYKSDVIRMLSDWEKTKEYEGMNFWERLVKEYEESNNL